MSKDEAGNRKRGGVRPGSGPKSKWKTRGKTIVVRIPEAIAAQVLRAARAIDEGQFVVVADGFNVVVADSQEAQQHSYHWVEKYYVKKNGNKEHLYYRYAWREGKKTRHKHIPGGDVSSELAQKNSALVKKAIAQGSTVDEILQLIESRRTIKVLMAEYSTRVSAGGAPEALDTEPPAAP